MKAKEEADITVFQTHTSGFSTEDLLGSGDYEDEEEAKADLRIIQTYTSLSREDIFECAGLPSTSLSGDDLLDYTGLQSTGLSMQDLLDNAGL